MNCSVVTGSTTQASTSSGALPPGAPARRIYISDSELWYFDGGTGRRAR